MSQHPALLEAMAQDRAVELRRRAEINALSRERARRPRVVTGARQAAGWFLVEVGLRLAAAPGHVTRSA